MIAEHKLSDGNSEGEAAHTSIPSDDEGKIANLRQVLSHQFIHKGTEHPETLTKISELADLLFKTYKFDESEVYYRRSYEGRRRALGKTHITVYFSLARLAECIHSLRRFKEARLLFEEALLHLEAALGRGNIFIHASDMHPNNIVLNLNQHISVYCYASCRLP